MPFGINITEFSKKHRQRARYLNLARAIAEYLNVKNKFSLSF